MKLSKAAIAIIGLVVGLGFILFTNPPHTPCTSQLDQLKIKYTPSFVLDTTSRYQKTTGFRKSFLDCKNTKNSGGCFAVFRLVEGLYSELAAVQISCFKAVASVSEFRDPMWGTARLLAEMAWKNEPSNNKRTHAWLDRSHLSLFCKLKNHLVRLDGQNRWDNFREDVLRSLPATENMQRTDIWKKSIFAINCQRI